MATIYIDNQPYEVAIGQNLLQACLTLGFDLPYFCWHPAMHSVGACRQCAVKQFKDEQDTLGQIVMSCMAPVREGMRISIDDAEARAFRAGVIEWLMVNHPHDCPICDEGGECHLQDMTVMTGHTYRRYRFTKRTFRNQDLGPLVNHEMNRCIECYRCLRFYRDYADGRDFNVFSWHDNVYFGRSGDGTLGSEFSGNLVEICPTGVFTDKTLKQHYTRSWDLQTSPSVCVNCAVGCNTIPGERYGELRRIRNRYNLDVNGYFLCDRGRYGYEFVNDVRRLRSPMRRGRGGPLEETPVRPVLEELGNILRAGREGLIGLGSPRASLEANYALRKLVGPERFYWAISDKDAAMAKAMLDILRHGPAHSPSLHDIELADGVLILGEDVTNVAPMVAYSIRQALRGKSMHVVDEQKIDRWNAYPVRDVIQNDRWPMFVATPDATKLDDVAAGVFRGGPDQLVQLGFAVARELNPAAGEPIDGLPQETIDLARRIAKELRNAQRPLVICGPGCGSLELIQSAANVAWSLAALGKPAALCFTPHGCNSMGLAMLGGAGGIESAHRAIKDGPARALIVLEADLYQSVPAEAAEAVLVAVQNVIVIDHLRNATTDKATAVLPAGTFAESDGTLVNNEGRAQRFYRVFPAAEPVRQSWQWIGELLSAIDPQATRWKDLDELIAAMVEDSPALAEVAKIAPPADFRIDGQKIPRQPHRYSGRTAMHAEVNVNEPQPAQDADSALAFSMEGYEGQGPSSLVARYWSPGWNSVQALNKFQQEVGGLMRQDQSGRRLIEPTTNQAARFFSGAPKPAADSSGQMLIVPSYHIHGSEELSVLSPAIAQLSPVPYLGLSPCDAGKLGLLEGQTAQVTLGARTYELAVRIRPGLATGVACWGVCPQAPRVDLPAWGIVKPPASQGGPR